MGILRLKGFRKLKLREVNKLAWGHTAPTWKSEESNHGLSNLAGLTGRCQNTLTVSPLSHTLTHIPVRSSMTNRFSDLSRSAYAVTHPLLTPATQMWPLTGSTPGYPTQPPPPLTPLCLNSKFTLLLEPYFAPLDFLQVTQSDSTCFPKSPFFSTLALNLFL